MFLATGNVQNMENMQAFSKERVPKNQPKHMLTVVGTQKNHLNETALLIETIFLAPKTYVKLMG